MREARHRWADPRPGRRGRPESITTDREYGFRARRFAAPRKDARAWEMPRDENVIYEKNVIYEPTRPAPAMSCMKEPHPWAHGRFRVRSTHPTKETSSMRARDDLPLDSAILNGHGRRAMSAMGFAE
jgi:hypothetical protein